MKRSKRAMRRVVLSMMYDLLERTVGLGITRSEFVDGIMPMHEVDVILSFKSSQRLEELRSALSRIDDDAFGRCIGCKQEIGQDILDRDPGRRMCDQCEHEYSKPVMHLDLHEQAG